MPYVITIRLQPTPIITPCVSSSYRHRKSTGFTGGLVLLLEKAFYTFMMPRTKA